ncbi:kinase-like protein [Aspergillus steynii IBT 23096]|uniref:EKC/KEOPS complex subunit BUD32 n=1 Tax=Aspergillus steynii IBT 23096 TaxID=1392250 RepID=A0A2I2G4E7_9EURO|nr:kinase-like protein [Aspergillus steynii IBT 23096]PLB47751.1 kinase-like protein [Aspergillus steynii IBT 23096]
MPYTPKMLAWGGTAILEQLPSGAVMKTPIPNPYCRVEEEDHRRNMRLEAQIYSMIGEHPRVPKLIHWDPKTCCLEIEHLENGNLKELILQNHQNITPQHRLQWSKQAAEALTVLHRFEVIHCDLSPRNFLLDSQLNVKIADIGGASLCGSDPSATPATRFRHPDYDWNVFPVFGDDIFSLGSLIYFIMTGSYPYEEISSDEVEKLYDAQRFPDVSFVVCGNVSYYPTRIGEVIKERYQVIGKLGFGFTSTVWLARDLDNRHHVMLKIFIQTSSMGQQVDNELNIYEHIKQSKTAHPGRDVIRTLLDTFYINGPQDKHRCLVHPPLWESVLAFLRRNPVERLPSPVIAVVLHRLFLALDFLHTECQIAHTDIKADNIMFGINDNSVFTDFEAYELQRPVPRKEVDLDGRTIYMSQELKIPKRISSPILCDFGSAVHGAQHHSVFIQPQIYRAPEVILGIPWTFSADIWNVGCMIWDIYEGGSLFTGYDPEFQRYRSRAHIAEMINLLGPPPSSLLTRASQGELSGKFFSSDGQFLNPDFLTDLVPLEQRETTLEGKAERDAFLRFMRKMLQWDPGNRSSAKELADDEWIHSHM